MIVDAITSFLGTLIEQVMKPVREFLADTLLATPNVTKHADVKRLWTVMLEITCGIYVLFVTAGGVTVMGYETVQTRYAVKHILPRLLLGIVAAATSLTVMGKAIGLANALAHAIMATDMADAGQGMVERVLPFALFGAAGLKLYLLLLAIMMIALVLAVLIGFMVRVAVLALLAVCAPLALACHAHPVTDPVARLWWRALGGCLVIQVAQSVTFVLAIKLFFAPGATTLGIPKSDQLGTMLAGSGLFWVLFKIPGWTLQVILRGTPIHQPQAPVSVRMLRHLAMYRLMDHYLPGMSLLRRRPGGPGGGGAAGLGRGSGGPRGGGGPGRGGGGGSRPLGPGPAEGRDVRGRGLLTRGRAAPSHPSPQPAGHQPTATAPSASGTRQASTVAHVPPAPAATVRAGTPSGPPVGQTPRRPGPSTIPVARAPKKTHAVIHPSHARRVRPRALPVPTELTPARSRRPTQTWLPIHTERRLAQPTMLRARPTAPSASQPAGRMPLARQLALRIPSDRVRLRPPRPMQLRLPLEPPRR
ncbi:hypothetical protein [Streptomyces chattanoogensis]|uniref:Uncharacterized protein n=1 Tax=Streptomyces chattanoogensis TaxID=66876 RepID=A0A0N1JWR4_9ACTN|nr:hypothetical protein [Streptomyces chattanoogensis]KPC61335.1 hypothetical protein ADL29_25035 [Streptomyces chattanoogensis]